MTKWKIGGLTLRKGSLFGLWAVLISAYLLGCGGAQDPNAFNCDAELNGIMSTKLGEYCDGFFAENMQNRVQEFRRNCPVHAQREEPRLNAGLMKLDQCFKKQQELDALNQRCTAQMKDAEEGMDCLGQECVPYVDYVAGILELCKDPALKGVYQAKADALQARLRVRIEEADSLSTFMSAYHSCSLSLQDINDRNAEKVFKKTTKNLEKKGGLDQPLDQGSEQELTRAMMVKKCGQVLQSTLELITTSYAEKLSDEALLSNERKWSRQFKKLEKLQTSLIDLNAGTFFPVCLEIVDNTISQFGEEEVAPEEMAPEEMAPEEVAPEE